MIHVYLVGQKIMDMQRYKIFWLVSPSGQKVLEFSLPDQLVIYRPFDYFYLRATKEKTLIIKERLQENIVLTISCKGSSVQCKYSKTLGYSLECNPEVMSTKASYTDGSEVVAFRRS